MEISGRTVLSRADWEHTDLHRRQPQRQSALIVLQQGSDDAVHGADGAAVDHHHRLS